MLRDVYKRQPLDIGEIERFDQSVLDPDDVVLIGLDLSHQPLLELHVHKL